MPNHILNYADHGAMHKGILDPPGFLDSTTKRKGHGILASSPSSADSYAKLKQKRAWDLAISPAKSLPMNAFMLYMSGGGVQIFSIGILAVLLLNPIKAMSSISAAFAPFAPSPSETRSSSTSSLILPKLVYIACNILTIGLGLYKCQSMGLLPTGSADWLAFETRGPSPEISL